jgi:superfamily II DNA or RNA helicase
MTLLDPQIPHANTLIDSLYINGVAADLSETGCGKTYVATYIAKKLNVPVLVVCPKGVITEWQRVLASVGINAVTPNKGKAVRYDGNKPIHFVVNYEQLIRGTSCNHILEFDRNKYTSAKAFSDDSGITVKLPKHTLIILDEAHKCKGDSSITSSLLIAFKKQHYKVLLMSATAATMPTEMRAFGYATNLHNGDRFREWLSNKGEYSNSRFGIVFDMESAKSQLGMRMIHHDLFDVMGVASRLTRLQMKAMFPDNRVFAQCFDMGSNTDKINAVYDQMQTEIAKLDEDSKDYSAHKFAEIVKARRLAEVLKVPTMVDEIEELYREGMSPVVFVNFNETVQALTKRLERYGDKVGFIVGGQSVKKRQSQIDDFKNDRKRIMIVNLAAGNDGIGLHDLNGNYPRCSIISPSYSAINLIQALGRIHRANGKTPCIQKIMFAAGTIEESCCERVQSKLDNLDLLNDGDLVGDVTIWN